MPTGSHQIGTMLRAAAASYTTVIAAFLVMTALHLRWLHRSVHAGDVLSAYGAGLVVLGVLVGSRPYLRSGLGSLIEVALPAHVGMQTHSRESIEARERERAGARSEVARDVLAERVIAIAVVVAGTLLNAWGTPLARRWGWPL